MSSTTMMPRIRRLSGFANRRSSMSSFVTIAEDEMPTAPAITSASGVPHPSAKPERQAAADVQQQVHRADPEQLAPARDEVVEARTRDPGGTAAGSGRARPAARGRAGSLTRATPGVFGPKMTPAAMKNGIVGRPMRRPSAGEQPAARNAPPTATSVSPMVSRRTTWRRNAARSSRRPITTSRSPAGARSVGSGATIGTSSRQDGGDGHLRLTADLEFRDRLAGAGRVVVERDPVDEQTADHRLDLFDDGRLEVRAAEDGAERAGLRVGERRPTPAARRRRRAM